MKHAICPWCMKSYGLEMVLLGPVIAGHMQKPLGSPWELGTGGQAVVGMAMNAGQVCRLLDLEPLFRMLQKYSSSFGEKCFCGKLDLAPGVALSCLLTTFVDEVLWFVLLLVFEILRHHLPIWTSSALRPTTPAICCSGTTFSLMLPLPLWNGTSGLHCFVWLNSEFSSLYLQLPLFTRVLQADTCKTSEMSGINGVRSCCFGTLPLVLQRRCVGWKGRRREHIFPYCLPLSLTPEVDGCFL